MSIELHQKDGSALPPIKLLWTLIEGHRNSYGIAALALVIATAFEFCIPLAGSATIDFVLSDNAEESNRLLATVMRLMGGSETVRAHLWIPAAIMLGLAIVSGVFKFAQKRYAARASDGICKSIKDQLYEHIQRLPNHYIDRAQTGDLVQRCTSDIETMRMFLATWVVEIGRSVVLIVAVIPILLSMNAWLTLYSLVLLPLIISFGYFYVRKVKSIFKEVDEAEGRLTSIIQENITGIRVVRAFGQHSYEIEKFSKPNREYRDTSIRLIKLMSYFWAPSDMINLTQIGLSLIIGTYMAMSGLTSIGTLFAFLILLNMVLWPVRMMGRILTDWGKTVVAIGRINEILTVPLETENDIVTTYPDTPIEGRIAFEKATFSHSESSTPTIADVSFAIEPGETLAILGPSGAGKSTLMHLLLRFYDCDKGQVLIDGMNVKDLERSYVRSQFGVVMQEPFLYSRSIKENILFGTRAAKEKEIRDAARLACIHDSIMGFSDGYDTEIGERGITLSGGQRQRVAISRAILANPPVLLLDDALSAVDYETEAAIIDALESRRGNRTTIVIAHRLSTLAHADRIIVMESGKIIQTGTHEKLRKETGLYQRLWNIQTQLHSSFEKEATATSQ